MKKLFAIVALSAAFVGSLFAQTEFTPSTWQKNLSIKSTVGFESNYLFRGKDVANSSLQTSVEAWYKVGKGNAYVGAWNNNPLTQSVGNEVDLYAGYKFPVYEKWTADVGGTYYYYTNSSATNAIDYSRELYVGTTYNGLWVNPALYVYYDFDLEQVTVELSGTYSWDLAKYGWTNSALEVGGYVGLLQADDTDGNQNSTTVENSYTFYGVTADLVHNFSKTTSASVGVRYAGNNDNVANNENTISWGAKMTAGF